MGTVESFDCEKGVKIYTSAMEILIDHLGKKKVWNKALLEQ